MPNKFPESTVPCCPCCGYALFEDHQELVHLGLRFVVQDFNVYVYKDNGPGALTFHKLPFTSREAALLMTLAMFKGRVVSKGQLYDALYPKEETEPKIIDVFICKIRRKLLENGLPLEVLTDWGRGYAIAPLVLRLPAPQVAA